MNASKTFSEVQPGRYQNAINRTVDILSFEMVQDPNRPHDPAAKVRKWTGNLLRSDGKTIEQQQHFEDNGSIWWNRGIANPMDLKIFRSRRAIEARHAGKLRDPEGKTGTVSVPTHAAMLNRRIAQADAAWLSFAQQMAERKLAGLRGKTGSAIVAP